MAKQTTIDVTIGKDGTIKIEASGFTGGACLKETESLEAALGTVASRTMKPEAHKSAAHDHSKLSSK